VLKREKRKGKFENSFAVVCREGAGACFSLFSLEFESQTLCAFIGMKFIGKWQRYCRDRFQISQLEQSVRDTRKRPIIPTSTVVKATYMMPVLGHQSLLAVDQFNRQTGFRRFYKSPRKMVLSDTTHERVLRTLNREDLLRVSDTVVKQLDQEKLLGLKLPSGRTISLGIVDGSQFSALHASVFVKAGAVDAVVDLEPYPGRGHELHASRQLMQRVLKQHGSEFIDMIVVDGLYPNFIDFRTCRENGCHLLVKVKGSDNLSILKKARKRFFLEDGSHRKDSSQQQTGLDRLRGIEYEVTWAEKVIWNKLEYTAVCVKETYLKPSKNKPTHTEFWIITTAKDFTGEDFREIAHRRWNIENQAFKRLNALVKSKIHKSHSKQVAEALLRLWFLGMTLLSAFLFERGLAWVKKTYKTIKITWIWITRQLLISICAGRAAP
jgi:hypothetical protein